jgi:hypothetical protein
VKEREEMEEVKQLMTKRDEKEKRAKLVKATYV